MVKKRKKKGGIKTKKRDRLHELDRMRFKDRTQEKMFEKLSEEFITRHFPKIMYIVPTEVRGKLEGEDAFNTPGKLYKGTIDVVGTKNTYLKRIKTYIKWQVINSGISSFGDITKEMNDQFFEVMAKNMGQAKYEYSKRTFDNYVDGTCKMWTALAAKPVDAKVKLEGREFAQPLKGAVEMMNRKYKKEVRSMITKYSKDEYKRGSGYTTSQASSIMRAAEKTMSTKDQLLVALLVHGALRNDESQQMSLDCFNHGRGSLDLLKKGMTKQDRGRAVLEVHPKIMELAKKLEDEGVSLTESLFESYDSDIVRGVVKDCCRVAKVKYSGAHDLRKAFVEKFEREMYSKIRKGLLTKEDLVKKIMLQVSVKGSLNPMVPVKETRWKTVKGKRVPYPVNKEDDGKVVEERRYTVEKLMAMNIEDLADRCTAEQLGHSDSDTTYDYRSEKATNTRKKFRIDMKKKRQWENNRKET